MSDLRTEQYDDDSNLSTRAAFNDRFSVTDRHPHRWAFEHLEPDGRVLEVGCGNGGFWAVNVDRIEDRSPLLTDFSPGMVREATRKLAGVDGLDPRFAVAEATDLPVGDGAVDAVVANFVLYHVPDRPAAFEEFQRVLRPGGHLYATTVSAHSKRTLYELLDEAVEGSVERINQEFTVEEGAAELRASFDRVETHRFEARLRVTEADPLVEYALSLPDAEELAAFGPGDADALQEVVQDRLEEGPIEMCNDKGLFVAHL